MNNINEPESIDKVELAKEFARKKFEEAGTGNHFLEVYEILKDEFDVSDRDVLIASLLHDTLEDTDTTYEELEQTFSKDVADLVEEVSHPKNYNKEEKIEFYEKLKHISSGGKMIKLADFTSHLRKFIGAFTGESDYPKMTYNEYCVFIRSFLESCEESNAKNTVSELNNELDAYITNK
ncbi:MAG: HD domain-containing protein [Patescibacteria group bacterium]